MTWKQFLSDYVCTFEQQEKNEQPHSTPVQVMRPETAVRTYPTPQQINANGNNDMYEKIVAHTDFKQAHTIQKILDFEKPLEIVITDPVLRTKAALAQANSQGITPTMIVTDLKDLDSLISQAEKEFQDSFKEKDEELKRDTSKADDLEKQLHDLRASVSERKTKLDRAEIDFNSALNRRKNDLVQLRTRLQQ